MDVYEVYIGETGRPEDAVNSCKSATAQVLAWLATSWHQEAIGTEETPGTGDAETMRHSAELYNMLLDKFPDMENLEFPDINREDWPTRYRVAYYYAELLWKMEDWTRCGPAFDTVVELDPEGEYTAEAAYAAVLCYNNFYQQEYAGREREVAGGEGASQSKRGRRGRRGRRSQEEEDPQAQFRRRDLTELETRMLAAFQRYVCFVTESEDLPTIKYRRARIYYEAHHYEEAAHLFRDIATNHRDSDLAEYAANLYLDTLNLMATRREPKRHQCLDELKDNIQPLYTSYCPTEEAREEFEDLCTVLQQLRCDVQRKLAESYQEQEQWRRAATTYVDIARNYSECGRLDEVLYNAAINYEAARLLGRAIRVRTVLMRNYPESDWAKRAVFLVGANYHALAFYEQAASFYERFARTYPTEDGSSCTDAERESGGCPIAHLALQNATFFRLSLNDVEAAEANARLFARNYRRRMPLETSQVQFSLGSVYERAENWPRVIEHYRRFLRDYRR
ncbi:MAG: tetratricopeptide repeat protein, partial [Myxococcales bacterium]|nr:tetratricopeptide repeat protein [Myxococcales bacterium]